MQDFDKTTFFKRTAEEITSSTVTVFDGDKIPYTLKLNEYGKSYIHFGRDSENDIVLTSKLVSAEHGRFVYKYKAWYMENKVVYKNIGSTNGLIYNNSSIKSHYIAENDCENIICAAIPTDRHGNLTPSKASKLDKQFAGKLFSRQRISEILSGNSKINRFDLITLNFFKFSQKLEEYLEPKQRYIKFLSRTNKILEKMFNGKVICSKSV